MSTESVQVVKVEFNGVLKRFNFPKKDGLLFDALERKVRELFDANSGVILRFSYTDEDGDVISMSSDEELNDALVLQGLNPLRVNAETLSDKRVPDAPSNKPFEGEFGNSFRICDKAVQDVLKEVHNIISNSIQIADSTVKDAKSKIEPLVQAGNIEKVLDAINESGLDKIFEPRQGSSPLDPEFKAPKNGGKPNESQSSDDDSKFEPAVHFGVECDECNMNPIIGNRYKSTVKPDYDACEACFAKDASQSEYIKIEQPQFFRRGYSSSSKRNMRGFPPFRFRPFPPFFGGRGGRFHGDFSRSPCQQEGGKYDARFVKDVTVFDGTEISPNTPFTKIWRLRNSGSLTWPRHLQLVHVGGDNLGNADSFPIELPEQGVPPGEEVQISVDLVSPDLPGRYVSHWRLCLPDSIRFGHRFWVLILVAAPGEQSPQVAESLQDSSKKCSDPPEFTDPEVQEEQTAYTPGIPSLLDEAFAFTANTATSAATSAATAEFLAGVASSIPPVALASVVSPLYSLRVSGGIASAASLGENTAPAFTSAKARARASSSKPAPAATPAPISTPSAGPSSTYPTIFVPPFESSGTGLATKTGDIVVETNANLGDIKGKQIMDTDVTKLPTDLGGSSVVVDDANYSQEAQMEFDEDEIGRLVSMGFADEDVNFEVLKRNEFDLQKTLDDLVKLNQWNSSFADLEEMGFTNKATNCELMLKHDGVIKRVVRELVDSLATN